MLAGGVKSSHSSYVVTHQLKAYHYGALLIYEQRYMRLIASAWQTPTFVTGLALRAKIVPVTLIAYTANVIGSYGDGYAVNKEGIRIEPYKYVDYETGELKFYRPVNPVARYIILNFKTDELNKYVDWEDIPESDRAVFQKLRNGVQ